MDTESSTLENAKIIKPIDKDTVHKICSGQVVVNLAIAVKELVENALDAGATLVEVRLKNHGIDLVEISDNGTGVLEDNFAALTLKYHTSKLRDFSDLLGVTSYGFRGEALSSLCALADLTVTTRHSSSPHATKIEYDHKGLIRNKTACSRQVGTTVTLANLFSTLPVRQKEFHKNVKREFNKMTQLLYAYCLVAQNVKIICTNQTKTGVKSIVVATQGSKSYRDNIACVFGSKQLQALLEIKQHYVTNIKENIISALEKENSQADVDTPIEDVDLQLSEDSNDEPENGLQSEMSQENKNGDESSCSQSSNKCTGYKNDKPPFEFYGLISSCAHGSGRSTTDRQYFFVNSRPFEPGKIMKLVNETYRQFNPHQSPFIFLNLNLNRSAVDINVTPDKRQVFLIKEKMILDVIRNSLLKTYEYIPSTFKMENTDAKVSNHLAVGDDKPKVFNSFLSRFASKTAKHKVPEIEEVEIRCGSVKKRKATSMLDFVETKTAKIEFDIDKEDDCNSENNSNVGNLSDILVKYDEINNDSNRIDNVSEISQDVTKKSLDKVFMKSGLSNVPNGTSNIIEKSNSILSENLPGTSNQSNLLDTRDIIYLGYCDNIPNTQIRSVDEMLEMNKSESNRSISNNSLASAKIYKPKSSSTPTKLKTIKTDKESLGKHDRKCVTLKTSIEHVKALIDIDSENKLNKPLERVRFKSQINPASNKKCEEELQKEISKESFKFMKVIGQFNLGFIVAQLEDDLFIIDQHATDEIYNFETLQKTTELSSQKLVAPQQLELTGVNEQILMDNLEVFKRNGFTFQIDEEALPTKRVKLLTIPMSKNWIFGKDDIEELLFMLKDAPSEYCRPSRVRGMFASRACRKSVMIGTALTKTDMKKLVDHMADIDKPWNCPHGRPTIRHLVNLAMVNTD